MPRWYLLICGLQSSNDEETNGSSSTDLQILSSVADADALVERAGIVARATFIARDLVNTAPSHLYPATFADEIEALVDHAKVNVTIYDEAALAEGGFGGLLGVGQGSANPHASSN